MRKLIFSVLAAVAWPASPSVASSFDSARTLCEAIDGTGLDSSPCQVGVDSVTIVLDMEPSEARKFCGSILTVENSLGLTFEPNWRLFIRSLYSGDQSIAFCKLGL